MTRGVYQTYSEFYVRSYSYPRAITKTGIMRFPESPVVVASSTSQKISHTLTATDFPSPRAVATERKRDDDIVVDSADILRALLSSAITSYVFAEIAVLYIMKTCCSKSWTVRP